MASRAFACLLLGAALAEDPSQAATRIHMVIFATDMYSERFRESLSAKERYAKHWGYSFKVFDESSLDCEKFRPFRFRGDYRYCKLEALKTIWRRIAKDRKADADANRRDYIFWHDVDTHIMRPETALTEFLGAAGFVPVVFTDNALSLNNGVLFLEVAKEGPSMSFFRAWRRGCRTGEWPWADNGCMYEVLLQLLGGERYDGSCARQFRQEEFNEARPEPPTGEQLMACFNAQMTSMGMGCCGRERSIDGFAFLTGAKDAFNHHPCDELERTKAFQDYDRSLIRQHCFEDGMFMVHSKDVKYAKESGSRVSDLTRSRGEL
eukprot:s2354_g6.t1